MRALFTCIALLPCLANAEKSAGEDPIDQEFIADFNLYALACRNEVGGERWNLANCLTRDYIGAVLQDRGWCFGLHGQIWSEWEWHRCTPDSRDYAAAMRTPMEAQD